MFADRLSKSRLRTPKIVNRAFYGEVVQTSLVVTIIFVSLYVVISLVNLLGRAVSGDLPVHLIFVLLGLQTVKNLSLILPLALFIGILLTLGRWYRDNEMTVLGACGVGLTHFLRPAWVLAFWIAAIVALLSLYLGPLATALIDRVKANNTSAVEIGIAPGEFQRPKRGAAGVFYVERVGRDGTLNNIFASREQLGAPGVLAAGSGVEYTDKQTGDRYLVLKNGTRYEGTPGQADYKVLEYETYAVRLERKRTASPVVTMDEFSTRALWRSDDPRLRAEWQWRIAQPVSLFVLAALALAFAYTDARRGRFANLFTAIFVYFLYANLLGIVHAMLRQGRLPPTPGLWAVHVFIGLLAAYFLWRRAQNRPLLPALRGWHR
jgi:lipopolysaccharide export system permease protein